MEPIIQTQNQTALYDANSPWTSLTSHNILDNVILAFALLLTAIFIRSALTLVLYNQLRCFTNPDAKSYWAVSRVLIIDSMTRTWLPGGHQRNTAVPMDRYKERNHGQYVLSISVGVFLLLLEVVLIILAVPGRREIRVPSNRAVHVEIKAPESPVLVRYPYEPCFFNEKISGINLESKGHWSFCSQSLFAPTADSLQLPAGMGQYIVTLYENVELVTIFRFLNISLKSEFNYRVSINDTMEARVKISGTDILLRSIDALEKNLRMMENRTSLFVVDKLLSRSDLNGNIRGGSLILNISNAKQPTILANAPDIGPDKAANTVLYQATAAIFSTRNPGPDTPPLQIVDSFGNESFIDFNEPLLLGFYNGPIITTLGSLILALISVAIYILSILIYRSPGNMAWEVIISHGRLYGDVLMSGPNAIMNWSEVENCDNVLPSESVDLDDCNGGRHIETEYMVNRT